jgi:hypothetical protein
MVTLPGSTERPLLMFTLIRTRRLAELLRAELIPFGLALLIAEVGFKFGSFSLELSAFLVTWFALGAGQSRLSR